jgi:hypothetical protein
LILPVLLLAISSGCVPPGLAWLPDSSGFVYTGGKGKMQLLLFEVDKKKSRVLAADVPDPAWPGVSPDGKQIAVAWIFHVGLESRVRVLVVDRAGKVVHRSKDLEDVGGGDVLQVYWSPRGDKLLISEEYWARLYDLKTHKLTPIAGPAVTFGTTPIRPDGKAFLVHNWKKEYRLIDWEGKEQAIKPGFGTLKGDKEAQKDKQLMLRLPLYSTSGWDGPVATVAGLGSRFRIDTARLTLTEAAWEPPRTAEGWMVLFRHSFPKGATVRAVGRRSSPYPLHIEVSRPGKATELLVLKAGYVMFFPSPDGRLLAVRWGESTEALYGDPKKQDRILVLDAKGDVIANIKVRE